MGKWTTQDCSLLLALLACVIYPLRVFFAGGQVPYSLFKRNLNGQTHLITGVAANGIGYETALQLAKQNASLIFAVRNVKRGNEAAETIRKAVSWPVSISVHECDLANFASVRAFGESVKGPIHGLVLNAGVMQPPALTYTADGHELQFQSNHLSHFLLANLVAPKLASNARVVVLSSRAHEEGVVDLQDYDFRSKPYTWLLSKGNAYANSKLANVLHARALASKLGAAKGKGIKAVSVHPGVVATNLFSHIPFANEIFGSVGKLFAKTPFEGAQTTLFTLLASDSDIENGAYYADCAPKRVTNSHATDANAEALWQLSEKLTNSKLQLTAAPKQEKQAPKQQA